MSDVNFELFSNSKNQFGDLNKKLITTINTLDGSTFVDDLITSHEVPRLSVHSAYSS